MNLKSFGIMRAVFGVLLAGLVGQSHAAKEVTLMLLGDMWNSQWDTAYGLKMRTILRPLGPGLGTDSGPWLSPTQDFAGKSGAKWFAVPYTWPDFHPLAPYGGDQPRLERLEFRYTTGYFRQASAINTARAKAGDTIVLHRSLSVFIYTDLLTKAPKTVNLNSISEPLHFAFLDSAEYAPIEFKANALQLVTGFYLPTTRKTNSYNSSEYSMSGLDKCLDSLQRDTIWIRNRPNSSINDSMIVCSASNPFYPLRGRVEFFPPWQGAKVWAVAEGMESPLHKSSQPGWLAGEVRGPVGSTGPVKVVFKVQLPTGEVRTIDSSGNPYTLSDTVKPEYIQPSMGSLPGFDRTSIPLQWKLVFAWSNPWPDKIAQLSFGGDERVAGVFHSQFGVFNYAANWYTYIPWTRPDSAMLVSADGSAALAAVQVPAASSTVDTVWLTPKPTKAAPTRIEGVAYDYKMGNPQVGPRDMTGPRDPSAYFPFSQMTNSGIIENLVKPRLGADGKPQWTGKSICGLSFSADTLKDCTDSANSPSLWFSPLTVNGKAMNVQLPISVSLTGFGHDSTGFKDSVFFPLDTFQRRPISRLFNPFYDTLPGVDGKLHNFGFCYELHAVAHLTSDASLTVGADDDTWVYADSLLVLDLGGQHSSMEKTVRLGTQTAPFRSVVPLDLFHCERHVNASGLKITTNFPLYPAGQIQLPPPMAPVRRKTGAVSARMVSKTGGLAIQAPEGTSWSLEVMGLDGRLVQRASGTGLSEVRWLGVGARLVRLRIGGQLEQKVLIAQ